MNAPYLDPSFPRVVLKVDLPSGLLPELHIPALRLTRAVPHLTGAA